MECWDGRRLGSPGLLFDLFVVLIFTDRRAGARRLPGRCHKTAPSIYIGRSGVRIFHQAAIFLWKTEEGDHHKERKGRKGEELGKKMGSRK